MSTEPNSMRLQRLTKTMDLHMNRSTSLYDNSSEGVKLPALRAINKSIKYNDLSFATSRDLSKLRKQPDQINNIEEVSAHHTLVTMRKKYDNLSKARQQKQKEVDKLQAQHDKLSSQKNYFESDKNGGKDSVNQLYTSLSSIKLQVEEAEIEKKIMLNMTSRLKADKITYDLRKYNMQKELVKTQKLMKLICDESTKHKESDDKTQKMKYKLIDYISNEKRQRDTHLYSVQTMLNQKQQIVSSEQIRSLQMKEIAESTLQDKDAKQKNWYKVYLCTRFVERLLRDKMAREMAKFNTVEVAFKNIKTSTGVNSAEALVKKFLNKEDTYGELLGQIAHNEKRMTSLKLEGEQLRKETQQLENEQEQLNSTHIEHRDLSKQQKELAVISQKHLKCQTYQQKLISWLTRNLKKQGIRENKPESESASSLLSSRFKAYLETLNKNIEDLAEVETDTQDSDVKVTENNRRIDFITQEQSQPLQNKLVEHEEEWIDGERYSVIRNNDKFMKELKRKYEQIKKAQIEAEPKKKQVHVEKPKPAPVEE